jgi:hypothetical protein
MALFRSNLALAFLTSITATGAIAQSTTDCMVMGKLVHCDTSDVNSQDDIGTNLGLLIARMQENSLRKKLGKMMAAGDCQGAVKLAYEKGRLELGAQIARTCAPVGAR